MSLGFASAMGASALAQPSRPAPDAPRPMPPRPPRPGTAPVVGATEVVTLTTPTGFVDDVVTAEADRIAYVVADTASKAELHVYRHATKDEQVVDIAEITLRPVALELVGARAFVVGRTDDNQHVAALVELATKGKKPAGAVVYRLGPASGIQVITRDGKRRIAVHRVSSADGATRHAVELLALETGRRIAAARPFELDADGRNAKVDFRVNHWSDGMTRAHGIKAGEWDRKENQRAPDYEATYDLVSRKISDKQKITDLFEQRKRFQTLADAGDRLDFLKMAWDNGSIELWHRGALRTIELDQDLTTYDPKSLQGTVGADGSAWLALKVDPVNPEAVARKKADPEYVDVFRVGTDGKGVRKARVLAHRTRVWFGVVGDRFWLIERNQGFERGGKRLTLYQPQ